LRRTFALIAVGAVALTITGCAGSKSSQESGDERVPEKGPMTDLHRYVEHEKLSPAWDELQTDHLGDRHLLIHSSAVGDLGASEMTVIADDQSTRCRISRIRWNRYGVRGTILFEHGSTKPVGYTGAGLCATEPSGSNSTNTVRSSSQKCRFSEDSSITLHGLAWRGERDTQEGATTLSRRRAEYMRSQLEGTALPQRVRGVEAHGTDRSDVEIPAKAPVPGVYLTIDHPGVSNAEETFEFHDRFGPPIPEDVRWRLLTFLESHASQRVVPQASSGTAHILIGYQAPDGERARYFGNLGNRDRRALWALDDWAEALTKADCRYDRVLDFEAFLP